jgi:hypothetical protein
MNKAGHRRIKNQNIWSIWHKNFFGVCSIEHGTYTSGISDNSGPEWIVAGGGEGRMRECGNSGTREFRSAGPR